MVSWNVKVYGGASESSQDGSNGLKASFLHSTFNGMLLCKEDLLRTQPGFVPKLTPWGKARSSILELCNGVRSLAEIEREIYRRHHDLFPSEAEAAAFVAEVVTRYAG
jgi:hypothetical protein